MNFFSRCTKLHIPHCGLNPHDIASAGGVVENENKIKTPPVSRISSVTLAEYHPKFLTPFCLTGLYAEILASLPMNSHITKKSK